MLNEIFAFLSGEVIVHKIALLNHRVRANLTEKQAFAPNRVIKVHAREFFAPAAVNWMAHYQECVQLNMPPDWRGMGQAFAANYQKRGSCLGERLSTG